MACRSSTISVYRARASNRAPNRPTCCTPGTFVSRDSHERGDEFQRCATGTSRQIVFSDAMSQLNYEVVIRRENPHRLYEFLFFIHFHRGDYEDRGGTTAVLP
jgi:hypothetical protein